MGLFKKLKYISEKKKLLKLQKNHSIPNLETFDASQKTIVFISGTVPTFDQDSGSNRLKQIILGYQKINYNCIICVEGVFENNHYANHFSNLGIIVFRETNNYSDYLDFLKKIGTIDYVWFYGPNSLKKYLRPIKKNLKNATTIFDMVDIHFLRYKRALELQPKSISTLKRYKKYFSIETQTAKSVDLVVAISNIEKEIMSKYLDPKKIITISNIHYPKVNPQTIKSFENRNDLVFIGSSHTPNIDAIHYLYDEIMPKVWLKLPNIKVNVIGNVKNKIHSISHPNFNLLGFVENVEPYFITSKLMVAPLRYGAGVKGKIGQSFEYFLPVVTTVIGAEGMFLENKKNAYISETADEFSKQIITLYNDKEIWSKLSDNSAKSLYPFSKEKFKSILKEI